MTCKVIERALWLAMLVSPIFLVSGCQTPPPSYDAYAPEPISVFRYPLFEYSYFTDQPAGVAVSSEGRIFVSFSRWDKNPLHSVAEVLADGTIRPYPDISWNMWGQGYQGAPKDHFICVKGIVVDHEDHLWILDSAFSFFQNVIKGGAKLVDVNLNNDRVEKVIYFDGTVAPPKSYLNDLCIDTDKGAAYLSDSGTGAIIVTDLSAGTSRRLLSGHPSTMAEAGYVSATGGRALHSEGNQPPLFNVGAVALDSNGDYLYYHSVFARNLYRIETKYLTDRILAPEVVGSKVEKVKDTGAVSCMLMDEDDNLFLAMPEENAIKRLQPDGKLTTVVRDQHLQWPGGMSVSPDSFLYFTDSQLNLMPQFNRGLDGRTLPYRLFKIFLPAI